LDEKQLNLFEPLSETKQFYLFPLTRFSARMLLSQTGAITQMTDHNTKLDIARRFHTALTARDWGAIRVLLTDDAQWVLPGDNTISGTANGVDAVNDKLT
jgi:hypothetical protein